LFRQTANIDIVHVPFQGGGPAITAAIGGHIPMVLANVFEVVAFAKGGKIRPLAVTSAERAEAMPEVPTVREAGYPEVESTNWAGLVVPAATPTATVARLNSEINQALRSAEMREKFRNVGMTPAPGTPEEFGAFLQSESARYAKVVLEAGIKAE